MLQSWERRAAEGLSNAEYMRELRHRNDVQYQEQLRKRAREREDAETRRQTQRTITPVLTSSKQNKFKTRSYDRPWAATAPAPVKTSPTSVRHGRPDAQRGAKRSSVERLPDLVGGARSRPAEMKASKTSQRAQNNSSLQRKEQSFQRLQLTSLTPKTKPCKISPKHTASTMTGVQNRRKNVLKSKLHSTATHVPQETPHHTDEQRTTDTERTDFIPRQLTTPDQNNVNWTHFSSLENYCPYPESEPTSELHNPFQSLLDISSISEESLTTENSDSSATSTSSADPSIQEVWSPTSSDLDSSSPSIGISIIGRSSGHFQSLMDFTSDEDEDEGHFTSWHDLRSSSRPSTILQTSSPTSTLSRFSTPTTPPPDSPRFSHYEPTRRRYAVNVAHRQTPELRGDRANPLNRRGTSSGHYHLPAFEVSPGRSPPAPLDEVGRMASLGAATRELEDGEGAPGELSLPEGQSTSEEASQPRRASLNLSLVVLHNLFREVTQNHRDVAHIAGSSGNPETKQPSNPETLRRITERLLEEESDEEDEDMCRICQCKGTSPTNPLHSPCQCSGSLQYIHHDCLKRWIQTKIKSGAELSVVKTCELCKGSLTLDLDDFDVEEYYCQHRPTQIRHDAPELFLLLELQHRFSELLQVTQERSTIISRALESMALLPPHRVGVRR